MLSKYKFKDELGHPLENCVEYKQMQDDIENIVKQIIILTSVIITNFNYLDIDIKPLKEIANRYNINLR